MTVQELIEKLKSMRQNAEICFQNNDDQNDHIRIREVCIWNDDLQKEGLDYVVIEGNEVWS